MNTVTLDQAIETYERTVRDYPRDSWAHWIVAVNNSIEACKWTGYEGCPEFAEKVFDANKGDKKISMADEKDKP